MLELANEYQKYKNENDELHEDLERAQQELADANSENIRTRAECKKQIREMELRCSQFEKENAELKQMIENDDRRYDESTASTLATSMFSSREKWVFSFSDMEIRKNLKKSRVRFFGSTQ
jgi:chromosome segregation ATPase